MKTYTKAVIIILVLVTLIAGAIYFSGMFQEDSIDVVNNTHDGDNSTDDPIDMNSSYKSENTNNTASSSYKIVIDYNGKYTAGYGSANKHDDVTTAGHQEFDLGETTYVDVGAKKSDGGSGKLRIAIYKGDKLVKEGSTSEPYGEIILSYKE